MVDAKRSVQTSLLSRLGTYFAYLIVISIGALFAVYWTQSFDIHYIECMQYSGKCKIRTPVVMATADERDYDTDAIQQTSNEISNITRLSLAGDYYFGPTNKRGSRLESLSADSLDPEIPVVANMADFKFRMPAEIGGRELNEVIFQSRERQKDFQSFYYNIDVASEIKNSIIGGPLKPLENFRNPCWVGKLPIGDPYRQNKFWKPSALPRQVSLLGRDLLREFKRRTTSRKGSRESWRMRCLPLIFSLGVSKSGTTDLFMRLIRHPQVLRGAKENFYWDRLRTGRRVRYTQDGTVVRATLSDYVDQFDVPADIIRRMHWRKLDSGMEYHDVVTVDPTASYLWLNDGWETIPANRNLTEPRVILAHSIREFVPNARFVVILRQPSSRLYSHYNMNHRNASPTDFQSRVVQKIGHFRKCTETRSVRSCVYDEHMLRDAVLHSMRASFYSVFLRDWFQVFPREQFYVVLAEEYYGNKTAVLRNMFQFLDLQPLPQTWYDVQEATDAVNSRETSGSPYAPMWTKTKRILDKFFRPFDEDLARLLADKRYVTVWHPSS